MKNQFKGLQLTWEEWNTDVDTWTNEDIERAEVRRRLYIYEKRTRIAKKILDEYEKRNRGNENENI